MASLRERRLRPAATATTWPSDWDMAFTFAVMQAFDWVAGPMIEV
jgi:hypothetical protein